MCLCGLQQSLLLFNLPTSQIFGIAKDPKPRLEGHVFPNPVDTKGYMVMLVYKNASLTREGIKMILFLYFSDVTI